VLITGRVGYTPSSQIIFESWRVQAGNGRQANPTTNLLTLYDQQWDMSSAAERHCGLTRDNVIDK
jgi:hypothetical protein